MAASTITRDAWTNDTGSAASPNADGTVLNNTVLQNNVYARVDELLAGAGSYATLTVGGKFAVEGTGDPCVTISGGVTAGNVLLVRNTTAGTSNFARVSVGNDTSTTRTMLTSLSSTWTTSIHNVQDGSVLLGTGAGGLSIATNHASGAIRFYGGSTPTEAMRVSGTKILINETADTNITVGMCINQGGAGVALSFKGSGIAHALAAVETDTGGTMYVNTVTGGLTINGFMEGVNAAALSLYGNAATGAGDTTRSTAASGFIEIVATENAAGIGANENILVVKDSASTRALIDAEGDLHLDATSNINAWDDHEDVGLLEAYRVLTMRKCNFKQRFAEHLDTHREILARTGVLTLNQDGHHFVSFKGIMGLTIDGLRQVGAKVMDSEQRIAALEQKVKALTA